MSKPQVPPLLGQNSVLEDSCGVYDSRTGRRGIRVRPSTIVGNSTARVFNYGNVADGMRPRLINNYPPGSCRVPRVPPNLVIMSHSYINLEAELSGRAT